MLSHLFSVLLDSPFSTVTSSTPKTYYKEETLKYGFLSEC